MTRRTFVFLMVAAGLVLWYLAAAGGGFPLDDSWIHQTFGRNLALNGEWAFVSGQPAAASTSPLYTLLLSLGYRLGVSYLWWTHGLGIVALTMSAVIGSAWARRALPTQRFAPWIVGLALLTTWHHVWAASSGMETLIFADLVLALIVCPWWEGPVSGSRRWVWSAAFGVLSALTVLARPEGITIVVLVGLILLWRNIMTVGTGQVLQWIVGVGVAFLIVMAPYLWLNVQMTGGFLPDTAAAKFQQHEILLTLPLLERIQRLFVAIMAGGQVLFVPGLVIYAIAGLAKLRSKAPRWLALWDVARWCLPLAWACGLILLYALRLPADYQHGRYVLPALPALVLMGSAGLCLVWKYTAGPRSSTRLLPLLQRAMLRAWAITIVLLYAYYLVAGREIYRVDVAIINGEMVTAAGWIRDHLPSDELLAIHDIGAVGYFAPRPLLDIAGLITPEVVPLIGQPEALWSFMQEHGAQYLLAFPDQIPGGNPADPRLCLIYTTNAAITQQVGHANMQIYRLAWNQQCSTTEVTED